MKYINNVIYLDLGQLTEMSVVMLVLGFLMFFSKTRKDRIRQRNDIKLAYVYGEISSLSAIDVQDWF